MGTSNISIIHTSLHWAASYQIYAKNIFKSLKTVSHGGGRILFQRNALLRDYRADVYEICCTVSYYMKAYQILVYFIHDVSPKR